MSTVPFLLLAAAVRKQREEERAYSERAKKAAASKSDNNTPTKRRYNSKEFAYLSLFNSPTAIEAFKTIFQEGKKLDEEEIEKILDELETTFEQIILAEKERESACLELQKQGIELSCNNNATEIGVAEDYGDGHGFCKRRYGDRRRKVENCFNGIEIIEKQLDLGYNPYEPSYTKWLEEFKDLDTQIEMLEKQIKSKRMNSFKGQKSKNKISDLEEQLFFLKNEKMRGASKKTKKEIFENLTLEQKRAIKKYLLNAEKSITIGKKVLEYVYMVIGIQIDDEASIKDRKKYERTFARVHEKGLVPDSSFQEINEILANIIKEDRGYSYSYETGLSEYDLNNLTFPGLYRYIDWYFNNIQNTIEKEDKTEKTR